MYCSNTLSLHISNHIELVVVLRLSHELKGEQVMQNSEHWPVVFLADIYYIVANTLCYLHIVKDFLLYTRYLQYVYISPIWHCKGQKQKLNHISQYPNIAKICPGFHSESKG